MLSIVQGIKTTKTSRGSEKGLSAKPPRPEEFLPSLLSTGHLHCSPGRCPGHSWKGNGHPSPVATSPSELIPVGATGACEEAGEMQDSPLCSRQHSPLHEAPEPGQAADEPLSGVHLLQEVTGGVLDGGLHVRGTAMHELHHLQHHREAQRRTAWGLR